MFSDDFSSNPSTKDAACLRQNQKSGVAIKFGFDSKTILSVPKENFLANANNKRLFISLLNNNLVDNGFDIIHAPTDADCCIVHTALEAAKHHVVLIKEDTGLLILLLQHCTSYRHPIFFTSTRSLSTKVLDILVVQTML